VNEPPSRVFPRSLVFVMAVALAARLAAPLAGFALARPAPLWHEPDTAGYVTAASQLVRTGRFGTVEQPEIVRTPGYPLLLAIGTAAGHVDVITIALQIAFGCLTVGLVYATAQVAFERREIALASAWFCACEPLSVLYASKLLSETLFTTLIAATLWLLARDARRPSWISLFAAAFAVAAAALVRPIAYFLPGWLALVIFLGGCTWAARWKSLVRAALFLIAAMAPLVGWQVRNNWVAGYAGFSAISDINLYYYEAVPVLAAQRGLAPPALADLQAELGFHDDLAYLRRHPEQRQWPAARRFAWLRREALRILQANPGTALSVHLAGIIHTLTDSGRNAYTHFLRLEAENHPSARLAARPPPSPIARLMAALREKPSILLIHGLLAVTLAVYLALALVGVAAAAVWRNRFLWPAVAIGFYLLALSGGPAGYHRFRLPLVPVLSLLAGSGWLTAKRQLIALGQRRNA
jgi:4-amino-4-deoxy-L-arabinose transferase-like glycosyltransferase